MASWLGVDDSRSSPRVDEIDPRCGVVDDHRQVVGRDAIVAAQHDVGRRSPRRLSGDDVVERHGAGIGAEAEGRRPLLAGVAPVGVR